MKVYILWHMGYDEIEGVYASSEAAQSRIDDIVAADPVNTLYLRANYCFTEHEVKA